MLLFNLIMYRARTSNCRPLWVTLDPKVVIIRIFSKFPRKDTDNTHSFCLIMASQNNYTRSLRRYRSLRHDEDAPQRSTYNKKRPSTQFLKCYHSFHNDPTPLKFFFLKFPYANRFPMKGFYFKYFFNWGASMARFVTVTFFTL